jgi:hypothetical protein
LHHDRNIIHQEVHLDRDEGIRMLDDNVDPALGALNALTRGESTAQPELAAISSWVEEEERLLRPEELGHLIINRELS